MSTARELRVVWALVAASGVAVAVTYARLPARELYNVSGTGLRAGLGRALVDLNFPDGLIAVAVLGVIAPFLSRRGRRLALLAAALCLVAVLPGVVSQSNLDAKWINVVPPIGVVLAFGLTLVARGPASPRHARGDGLRLGITVVLVVLAAPWIAAELGYYLDGIPLLGRMFQTGAIVSYRGNAPHPAVHHGVHHGLHGLMLVVCALLLSRLPNRISVLLALMLAYGLGNIANDDWLEQVAERGWTSWTIPSGLEPSLTWTWLAVLIATPIIWALWFRRDDSAALPSR
jgi:hypothetical protein